MLAVCRTRSCSVSARHAAAIQSPTELSCCAHWFFTLESCEGHPVRINHATLVHPAEPPHPKSASRAGLGTEVEREAFEEWLWTTSGWNVVVLGPVSATLTYFVRDPMPQSGHWRN